MWFANLFAVAFALQLQEAGRYWRAIVGDELPAGVIEFAVDAGISKTGNDAYAIKSTARGARLVGSNERSTWYALYDLLERRGGCRYFWDGDRIPKKGRIDLSGLDVHEEARFEYRAIRYFAHRGLKRFQAEHWGPEDWKREIDWMLKRRLNCFMPRIGMDDTWQKAFPEVVPYPDPEKGDPHGLKGYNNRAPFWPLEYRGRLRRLFTGYAFARGLMIPTDFGTMTHWYSRTPAEFLAKAKPPFLTQWSNNYSDPSGLVWDVFKPGWMANYWRLTEAFVDSGYGTYDLLHTIGLGERRCFRDRAQNLQMKKDVLARLICQARKKAPGSKILLGGWDFYLTWTPAEVRELVAQLDPRDTIIWDYEAEAHKGIDHFQPELENDFTKWDVVGKFPYTFGIFLAFEQSLDVRADYPAIERRERAVANDPMCRGYMLWPESSHTDTLLLRYFTVNAWKPGQGIEMILPAFCRDRYGERAAEFERAWRVVLPISRLWGWGGNCVADVSRWAPFSPKAKHPHLASPELKGVAEVLRLIAALPKDDEFRRRDALDLARTVYDRELVRRRLALVAAMEDWIAGANDAAAVERTLQSWENGWREFAELLSRHPDYSLAESLRALNAVEKVRNPEFDKVLLDNALNVYCRSHQYEGVQRWILPFVAETAAEVRKRLRKGIRRLLDRNLQEQRANAWLAQVLNSSSLP